MKKAIFSTEISLLRRTIQRLLRRKADANLTKILRKTHPADVALLMRGFGNSDQKNIFNLCPTFSHKAKVLEELDEALIENMLIDESSTNISKMFIYLDTNDQAAIIGMFPEEKQKEILEKIEVEDLEDVEEIMSYPDDSAGSIMTKETFTLNQNTTIKESIKKLQAVPENDKIFYVYILDNKEKLVGVVSLRNLVTSKNTKKLKDIMIKDIHAATSETDQEEVAKTVAQYNYLALPVVNRQNRFLGVVTIDDVVDIVREEASEDFLQMAGVGKDREILLKSPIENAQSRAPWIFASLIGGICAAAIIGYFDHLIKEMIVLASFIPVIIGIGGNIGTQSSTIIVRGLATGRVDVGNTFSLVTKEIIVGAILGTLYGALIGFASEPITGTQIENLGLVIGLSIGCSMTIATAVGASVPLILKKLSFDPAISTGPFVTTAIDILGVALYFTIASCVLL
ncbi:MAG TPA: magnesium transporter [Candidatus Marinimicrobia bacterium]|nr:magnesium transporter [Candidatus Neomarinimicrobiota bacterium]|tara:strand:- start:8321 stop:9688 length:1368 start_codon:yes stop_codon:yes gene_type:complete